MRQILLGAAFGAAFSVILFLIKYWVSSQKVSPNFRCSGHKEMDKKLDTVVTDVAELKGMVGQIIKSTDKLEAYVLDTVKIIFNKIDEVKDEVQKYRVVESTSRSIGKLEKFLVIDDDPMIVDIMKRTIEKQDLYADTASDYAEAMKKLKFNTYDYVLIDYSLNEEKTGLDIYKYIDKNLPRTQALIFTGKDTQEFPSSTHVVCKTKLTNVLDTLTRR